MNNPYFEEVSGGVTVGAGRDGHTNRHIETLMRREELVEEYAWAVPNREAVEAAAGRSPLLEVMAGAGYWARLVADAGGDVLATDIEPETADAWFPVWKADARDVAVDYPDRALMMVWPPLGDEAATETLGRYGSAGGDTLVYVGEGRGGRTATERFHEMLYDAWELAETVAIPNYYGIRDRLEVWER